MRGELLGAGHFDVQGANGKVERWKVGGPSTNRMAANGSFLYGR